MAIHDFTPGISSSILIAGTPAIEYPDPDPFTITHPDPLVVTHHSLRTVSTYIIAEDNAPFSIKLVVGPPYGNAKMEVPKLGFYVWVDGNEVWKSTCSRPFFGDGKARAKGGKDKGGRGRDAEDEKEAKIWSEEITGVKEGKGVKCTIRDFRFKPISIDAETLSPEAKETKRLAQRLKKVGLIEIKVYRENYGRRGGPTAGSSKDFIGRDKALPGKVPEQALKGDTKSHGTTLEHAQRTKRGDVWRADKLDTEDKPLLVFRFMYRSEAELKQLHITESGTPSPSPSPSRSPSPGLFVPAPESVPKGLTPAQQEMINAHQRQLQETFKAQQDQLQELYKSFAVENARASVPPASKRGQHRSQKIIKREIADKERRIGREAKRRRNLTGRRLRLI